MYEQTFQKIVREKREEAEAAANAESAQAVGAPAAEAAPAADAKKAGLVFKAISVGDQGVIIGIGASVNVDKDKDFMTKGDLAELAYDFCASKDRVLKANHDEVLAQAELVQSWVGYPILKSGTPLAEGAPLPEDDPVVAIGLQKGCETHWFVGIRPNDPAVIERVNKGELVGFSWGGSALRTEA
jgi:hypothetical protein